MRESDGDADVDSVNVGDADCEGDAEKDDESDERALRLDDADCETDGVYVPLRVDVEDDVVVCVGDALWVAHAVMDGESVTVTEGVAHALLETDNVPDDENVGRRAASGTIAAPAAKCHILGVALGGTLGGVRSLLHARGELLQ